MAEYIEKDKAKELVCEFCQWVGTSNCEECEHPVDDVPAADVAPVRHGRWIDNKVAFYLGCSECGCYLEYAVDTFLDNGDHYHYCPNCGAKMDKEVQDG